MFSGRTLNELALARDQVSTTFGCGMNVDFEIEGKRWDR